MFVCFSILTLVFPPLLMLFFSPLSMLFFPSPFTRPLITPTIVRPRAGALCSFGPGKKDSRVAERSEEETVCRGDEFVDCPGDKPGVGLGEWSGDRLGDRFDVKLDVTTDESGGRAGVGMVVL